MANEFNRFLKQSEQNLSMSLFLFFFCWHQFLTEPSFNSGLRELFGQGARRIRAEDGNPVDAVIKNVLPHRQPLDYGKIITPSRRAIIMGEVHNISEPKNELIRNLSYLKKAGIKYLGLEMFPSDKQYLLNLFFEHGWFEQEILAILKDYWGYEPELYLWMIKEASRGDIRIQPIALGMPKEQMQALYRGELSHEAILQRTSEWIAQQARIILEKDGQAKMLIYVGYEHAERKRIARFLEKLLQPEEIVSLRYVGGEIPCPKCVGFTILEFAIERAGLGDKKFMLDLSKVNPDFLPQVDWIISLPFRHP